MRNPFRRRHPHGRRRAAPPPPPAQPVEPATPAPADPDLARARRAARIRRVGYVLLVPLGLLAASYSYVGVYEWVEPYWGEQFARGFPIVLDGLIAFATCFYIAGAMEGTRRTFWRLTAHGAVAGTILLNTLAAHTPTGVVVHLVGPVTWSLVVEGIARELMGEWKATHATELSRIPRRLWFSGWSSFKRSWRATLRMHRMDYKDYRLAFNDVDFIQAALRLAAARGVKGHDYKVVKGFLLDGSLPPREIIPVLQDTSNGAAAIVATVSQRVLDRDRLADDAAERAELDRMERVARIAAEERRIAAERAEAERSERERARIAAERRTREEEERPERDRDREDRQDRERPDERGDRHDRHEWTAEQLAWIQARLDEAWARNPTEAGKPKGSQIQALAKVQRPDLGIHGVNPTSVRGRVNKMWKAKKDRAAADEQGRVVQLRAGTQG